MVIQRMFHTQSPTVPLPPVTRTRFIDGRSVRSDEEYARQQSPDRYLECKNSAPCAARRQLTVIAFPPAYGLLRVKANRASGDRAT